MKLNFQQESIQEKRSRNSTYRRKPCKQKGIAIATLKQPVEFVEMGTDDEYVNAQVIFMLAVDEKGHLELLQAILAVLQDQEVLKKLIKAKDAKEIIEIIKEKENI